MTTYCSTAELATQIGLTIEGSGSASATALGILIAAAQQAIDNFCNRPDGFIALTTATARVFAGRGKPWLYIDECTEVTAVAVKDAISDTSYTAWASDDYNEFSGGHEFPNYNRPPYTGLLVNPYGTGGYSYFISGATGGSQGWPDPPTGAGEIRYLPTVQVTAKWGYATTVPDVIKQACITQAARWFKRGEASWADALASGDMGQLMYRQALDPDLKMMLHMGRYVRPAL